ncbi:MAG: SMC-Scp complex subunit ScpB [Clostridiaceae bacterium]|nr:SMC-Scp complex subunit ScpB [Clostridiaceae bacterium]
MEQSKLSKVLEAVLFAAGDSVSSDKLCAVLGIEKDEIQKLASELSDLYDYERRGVKLLKLNERYQLVSRPEYSSYVRAVLESGKPPVLSQSSMEVLAIIAYRQPTTRAYVEQIRGVDSSYTISSLTEKGIIEPCGRLDVPGRPLLYKTTEKFLRTFGLSNIEQLPYVDGLSLDNNGEQLFFEESLKVCAEEKA